MSADDTETPNLNLFINVIFENSSEYEKTDNYNRESSPPLCPDDIKQPMHTKTRGHQHSKCEFKLTQEGSREARAALAKAKSQEERTAMHNLWRMRETTTNEKQQSQKGTTDLIKQIEAMNNEMGTMKNEMETMKDEMKNMKDAMETMNKTIGEMDKTMTESNIENFQNCITNARDIKDVMQIIRREKKTLCHLTNTCRFILQKLMEFNNNRQQKNHRLE